MNNLLFSIIVPVYKTEEYIRQCVDSILQQNFTDFELILVDDGSPDNCPQICDDYASNDMRVKVIHKENGGLVSARKAGMNICAGQYVIIIDSDDYVADDMLEKLNKVIEKENPDIVCYGFRRLINNVEGHAESSVSDYYVSNNDINAIYQNMIYDRGNLFYKFGVAPSIWTKAIRKDIYIEAQSKIDERIKMGEDLAVTIQCMLKSGKISFLNEPLYYYRIIDSSISRTFNPDGFKDLNILIDFIKNNIDINKYDLLNQVNAYTSFRLIQLIDDMHKNNNIFEFRKLIKQNYTRDFAYALKNAELSRIGKNVKVHLFLIKNKLWMLYYVLKSLHRS